MNQKSLKNGRHASLEITQCHPLHISANTIQSSGWLYPYSGVEGSMQHLSSWFFKTIATSDQSQLSHAVEWSCACEQYLNSLDSQPGTQKMALPDLPLYMWGQSGELDETDYGDCIHPGVWLTCFNECVSTNQNGMFSILQLTSLKYRDNTMVFVVFIL